MIALCAGASAFFLTLAVVRPPAVGSVGRYLGEPEGTPSQRWALPSVTPGAVVGAAIGIVVVPGGAALRAIVGGTVGLLVGRIHESARRRRDHNRLGQELPTVADMCALHVLSGDSVVGSIRRFVEEAEGVAASEMALILRAVDSGVGFPEAAREAARRSAHRDGGRLYDLLAQAHRSGSRLVDSLEMFATDRRASIERELAVEGGRRALTGYGPILGLMIPTTLLFLMYPTLAGLDALASTR